MEFDKLSFPKAFLKGINRGLASTGITWDNFLFPLMDCLKAVYSEWTLIKGKIAMGTFSSRKKGNPAVGPLGIFSLYKGLSKRIGIP